jgi:hypothetical protein
LWSSYLPPLLGDLLIGSNHQISIWTRRQVADDTGFYVDFGSHGFTITVSSADSSKTMVSIPLCPTPRTISTARTKPPQRTTHTEDRLAARQTDLVDDGGVRWKLWIGFGFRVLQERGVSRGCQQTNRYISRFSLL